MNRIEEIQKDILFKWALVAMTRREISKLEQEREALQIAELRAKATAVVAAAV